MVTSNTNSKTRRAQVAFLVSESDFVAVCIDTLVMPHHVTTTFHDILMDRPKKDLGSLPKDFIPSLPCSGTQCLTSEVHCDGICNEFLSTCRESEVRMISSNKTNQRFWNWSNVCFTAWRILHCPTVRQYSINGLVKINAHAACFHRINFFAPYV